MRVDGYEWFGTDEWRRWLDESPIELIGVRALRDEWRRARRAGVLET